jgi:hypothetical protein
MKRSVWTIALVALVGAALVVPALAAGPSASKSVLGDDGSKSVVLVRVTAANQDLYGVTIKDASGSIADIVAPKGWVGISSGRDVIFRTGGSPIKAGTSASFRLVTSNEDGELTVSFRDKKSPVGKSKTL